MRIITFRDPKGWHQRIAAAAKARGHEIVQDRPDAAFARLVTFEPWRERGLTFLRQWAARGVRTLPEPANLCWYDDKLAQVEFLHHWLPETVVVLPGDPMPEPPGGYPFISKASTGAMSRNVRLVRTPEEARAEYEAAFGPGIPILPRGMQQGYLYWQRFIQGNAGDIRVIVMGDEAFGIRRGNRDDLPFASGSGRLEIIRRMDDEGIAQAFRLADQISRHLNTRWQAYDFVFEGDRCYCLEAACSWTDGAYAGCPTFDRITLDPTGTTQDNWPERAVIEMERQCLL